MHYIAVRRIALFKHTILLPQSSADSTEVSLWNVFDEESESLGETNQCLNIPPNHRPFRSYCAQLASLYPLLSMDFNDTVIEHLLENRRAIFGKLPVAEDFDKSDVLDALGKIAGAQYKARSASLPLRVFRATSVGIPSSVEDLPSFHLPLQWIFEICAEIIHQDPDMLLGECLHAEIAFYPKNPCNRGVQAKFK